MSTFNTYILYSEHINKFYIGSTSLRVEDRLVYHLTNHKGFTAKAEALEKSIKKRGAKRFLNDIND